MDLEPATENTNYKKPTNLPEYLNAVDKIMSNIFPILKADSIIYRYLPNAKKPYSFYAAASVLLIHGHELKEDEKQVLFDIFELNDIKDVLNDYSQAFRASHILVEDMNKLQFENLNANCINTLCKIAEETGCLPREDSLNG